MQLHRIRRTASDWQAILRDYAPSGLSGIAYCREHDIHPKSFYRSRSVYRGGDKGQGFIQSVVESTDQPSLSGIDLEFPHCRLRIDSGISPEWVAQLLKLL